ncbi:hypothetical protein Pfo_023809 [Paulownia fortunei]|nr:hypothetical protein Pfo_023809 [Paulownia fortunei]
MIMKIPLLFYPFLWFFLLVLLFHEFYNFKYLQNTIPVNAFSSLEHHPLIPHRKTLASKFDFTPFLKRHRHHRTELPPDVHTQPGPPGGSQIDPRYGVEKRLVPSGPNPLHH